MLTVEIKAPAAEAAPVRLSAVVPDQGIRRKLTERELVSPLYPVVRGRPTYVTAEEAARVMKAVTIALTTGIAIYVVLQVLNELTTSANP
jgi:hypothetical protein